MTIKFTRFKVNSPNVVSETIDEEAVIVNLSTGNYYSLTKAGADLWTLIEANATLQEAVEWLVFHYEGELIEIETSATQLFEQLQQDDLIQPFQSNELGEIKKLDIKRPQSVAKPKFEVPNLQKYTDMEDLLLLDPIHDVDESGWPNLRQDNAA